MDSLNNLSDVFQEATRTKNEIDDLLSRMGEAGMYILYVVRGGYATASKICLSISAALCSFRSEICISSTSFQGLSAGAVMPLLQRYASVFNSTGRRKFLLAQIK